MSFDGEFGFGCDKALLHLCRWSMEGLLFGKIADLNICEGASVVGWVVGDAFFLRLQK